MKAYLVEANYYKDDVVTKGYGNFFAINKENAKVEAINYGIRKGNPNGTGIEIVSIQEVSND